MRSPHRPPFLSPLRISRRDAGRALVYAGLIFGALGTLTALWDNPFFIRMTPVESTDYVLLALEAVLVGLFLGVRAPACAVTPAGLGGLLGFLGFGCALCNQVLLLVFGSGLLLAYFEPYRHLLGAAGIVLLAYALWRRLRQRNRGPFLSTDPA